MVRVVVETEDGQVRTFKSDDIPFGPMTSEFEDEDDTMDDLDPP
jgi:hypothetical protein